MSQDSPPVTSQNQEAPAERRGNPWMWPLVWVSLLLMCSVTGVVAIRWLTTIPPLPKCEEISPLAADSERLYCAQQTAQSGKLEDLVAGVKLVENWTSAHPLYWEAQRLTQQWSRSILELAQQQVDQNNLKQAVETANKIPETSPVYADAQDAIAAWQNNWTQGQAIYEKAQAAIKAQEWDQASERVKELSQLKNDYWRQKRTNELIQQITAEKLAWQQLRQARDIAFEETTESFGEAIALAQKVGPKSYARSEAQADISRWGRALLNIAKARLEQQDLDGAVAAAKRVPQESYLAAEADDWIQLGRAQAATWSNKTLSKPLPEQIWGFMEALALARQIGSDRPLHKQAQTQIEQWRAQLQDLVQLQFSSAIASLGYAPTLRIAIDQAQLITSDRPRRVHAQTLIAGWQKDIQRIEDQPYLATAKQLAALNTIDSLKNAIDSAAKVALGRALRVEAQTWIAQWTRQIEVLEDQIFLDRAQTLAKKGDLRAAIETAELIGSNRALYADAQATINDWWVQIQVTEDQPVLREARALAAEGSLSAAIDVASQIGRGRALYYEAQDLVSRWRAEQNALIAEQEAAATRAVYSEEPAAPVESAPPAAEPVAEPVEPAPPAESAAPAPPSSEAPLPPPPSF